MKKTYKDYISLNDHKSELTFIFGNEELSYPTEIIRKSDLYGSYKLKPYIYVNLETEDITKQLEITHKLQEKYVTFATWSLKEPIQMGSYFKKLTPEYIIYYVDYDLNLTWWLENNKDCRYLQKCPGRKTLPIAHSKMNTAIEKILLKVPFMKLKL